MFEPIDGYCESLDPGLWAEPVNFLKVTFDLVSSYLIQFLDFIKVDWL